MKRVIGFLAAVVLAFSAAACSQTDSGVTTKVKAKFAQDDLVKAHDINVTTRDGIVTLSGEVDTMEARQQALRLTRETEGVANVVDELRVEVEATTGDLDDLDVDIDVDGDLERGVRETGEAIRKGAEEAADAVTDDDRDSDRDGK